MENVIRTNPGGDGGKNPPNNPAASPPIFSWKWKIPHTMYSKPTQSRRTGADYADSVAQISSVGSIFVDTAIITDE